MRPRSKGHSLRIFFQFSTLLLSSRRKSWKYQFLNSRCLFSSFFAAIVNDLCQAPDLGTEYSSPVGVVVSLIVDIVAELGCVSNVLRGMVDPAPRVLSKPK